MAASIPQESFLTPRPISATAIYDALARFSTYESKRLPVPHSTRSAAVTIILRFAHEGVALDLSMLYTERGLTDNANLIHAALPEGCEAEILFIKRSVNPRDRWSGHVALPGGRQDGDETLRHTSARETMEEIGLDVESRDYLYLGSLDDRYTMPINIRPFLISTHVFLQVRTPDAHPVLDASEVAACRWVPLSVFHNAHIDHVSYPMHLMVSRTGGRRFSIGSMNFPGILLPRGEEHFPVLPETQGEELPGPAEPYTYHLWGITLDIVEDLSTHLGLCSRGSFSHLPGGWNPLVRLYIWHHAYIPHALKGAPLWGTLALAVTALGAYAAKKIWDRQAAKS